MSEETNLPEEKLPVFNDTLSEKVNQDGLPAQSVESPTFKEQSSAEKEMEVHHHPNLHHRKKHWKEYFIEFIMIFLAVTLGFFAESYREYLNDRSKEKEFIISIKKGLAEDTLNLNTWIPALQERVNDFDSLITILKKPENTEQGSGMYYFARLSSRARTFETNNNAITELKNSGNFRLINNQKVVDAILNFQKIVNNYLNLNSIETREAEITYPLIGNLFDATVFEKMLNTKRNAEVNELDFATGSKSNLNKPDGNPNYELTTNTKLTLLYITFISVNRVSQAKDVY